MNRSKKQERLRKNAVDLELDKRSRGDGRACSSLIGIAFKPCKSLHTDPDTNVYQNAQKKMKKNHKPISASKYFLALKICSLNNIIFNAY